MTSAISGIKIIECPRDAMQGITEFIHTETKIFYLNTLLKAGFYAIDFGSFVSPVAIPQMRDTRAVLEGLDLSDTSSKLLAIVANKRGAEEALEHPEISYLGFPLSISETFQKNNTNKTITEALGVVRDIHELCSNKERELVVYLSMAFGNPYADPYDEKLLLSFVQKLDELGITTISLSDTIGVATPELISKIFPPLIEGFPHIEFGAHLHSTAETAIAKIEAAYKAGCKRFDGAIKGFGGCPMAKEELTGNIATETILGFLEAQGLELGIDKGKFSIALNTALEVFPTA
ncbi:MAG TPA: hydroxymethylglutaryl-CoA lyase [Cytophagaceae bacterium]|jgi:hydroxymethylglutaryl-CoA lyase